MEQARNGAVKGARRPSRCDANSSWVAAGLAGDDEQTRMAAERPEDKTAIERALAYSCRGESQSLSKNKKKETRRDFVLASSQS